MQQGEQGKKGEPDLFHYFNQNDQQDLLMRKNNSGSEQVEISDKMSIEEYQHLIEKLYFK